MKSTLSIIFIVSLCLIATHISAQKISGVVANKTTQQTIAYANIGIVGKSVGTVSNEQGQFSLSIPSSLQNDTLKISVIGYESFVSSIQTLLNNPSDTIFLNKAIINLKEVVITPQTSKP